MRYFYEPENRIHYYYGEVYECNHPVYDRCTLYLMYNRGLAIIQQRHDSISKKSWWGEIDKCLADDIYLNKGFMDLFNKYANQSMDGLYPTITVRQAMWYLKMKPLKREPWETVFDKSPI